MMCWPVCKNHRGCCAWLSLQYARDPSMCTVNAAHGHRSARACSQCRLQPKLIFGYIPSTFLLCFSHNTHHNRPLSWPRTHWRDYLSHLATTCLRIPQEELEGVVGEDIWTTLCCFYKLTLDKRKMMNGWMDGLNLLFHHI